MNARRGHESIEHLSAKMIIGDLFGIDGWSVFYEQRHADILLLHHPTKVTIAVEIESSSRNVIRNIQRNHENGCLGTAVVSLDPNQSESVVFKVRRHTPPISGELCIFPYNPSGIIELLQWINEIVKE